MSIDTAIEEGLDVARFGDETQKRIRQVIATPSKARNPIDLFPDMLAHGFEKTSLEILNALLDDIGVHGIIFISFANFGDQPYRPIIEALEGRITKPLFFSLLGTQKDIESSQTYLEEKGFPCFDLPEMAVRVFARMWKYGKTAKRNSIR
jgi:acyl-CoA synthetase (NDP forming)